MQSDAIIKAVLTTLDPSADNTERATCFKLVEEYKNNAFQLNDLSILCGPRQSPAVITFGLKCLEHKIKHSWAQIDATMKENIKESLFELASNLHEIVPIENERKVVVLVLTRIFVYLIKCEWPQQWPNMIDVFFSFGKKGPTQTTLVLNTFQRLYEDVMQFQDVPQPRRRDILSTLNDNLPDILCFALDVIDNQLKLLRVQANTKSAISLCREALSMLSGFLDSCRIDVMFRWTSSVHQACDPPEIPVVGLFRELARFEPTRAEALDLLLLLIKRNPQNSEDAASKLCNALIYNSNAVNELLTIFCSTLGDQTVSERKYNILISLAEIVVRMGCAMVARWMDFSALCHNCSCSDQQQFTCPYQCNHLFNCVLRITNHPVRILSRTMNTFWLAALQSPDTTLLNRLRPYAAGLFVSWRNALKRDCPSLNPECPSSWMWNFYATDDYNSLFNKGRGEAVRCLNLAGNHWPSEYLQVLTDFVDNLLQSPVPAGTANGVPQLDDPRSNALTNEWDALESLLDSSLNSVRDGFVSAGSSERFELAVTNLVRQLLQRPFTMQPVLYGKQLSCTCLLMQYADTRQDTVLLLPLLTQIFACLRRNPSTPNLENNATNNPEYVKNLHRTVVSAFFKLTKTCPSRVMTHFEAIGTEVTGLWADSYCGTVEKCVLLEALILLCLRLPQSIEVQRDLLKQLVSHVTLAWVNPATVSTPTPMSTVLNACTTGGAGLLALLGLNQPPSAHQDLQSDYVQLRITLTQNVLALLAATRRLSEPVNLDQLQQITVPLLEPVLPSVLLAVRAFNELWLPENQALIHPDLICAFQMPEHLKSSLLSIHASRSDRRCPLDPKSPVDRIRTNLYENHENILTILSFLLVSLSPRLYTLPSNQLAVVVHQNCCAAFEHLSDYKIHTLLRLVIRQYIRCCPREYFSTALVPLLAPIIEAVVQRLDRSWNQVVCMSQAESADEKTVAAELIEERVTRLLSRTLMDLLRLIYSASGYVFASQTPDEDQPGADDGMEDVDMAADSKSSASSNRDATTDSSQLGVLARTLIAEAEFHQPADNSYHDPVFLNSLARCLTWPDSAICLKASQWIPVLIDALTQIRPNEVDRPPQPAAKRTISPHLAEMILFGVLCGLRTHGKNPETNLPSLLVAGSRVYTAVDSSVARENLRNVLAKVLLSASDATNSDRIMQSILNFEEKLLDSPKPLAEKAKRDIFKKVVQPIIGVPLSEQFRDPATFTTLAPLRRSKPLPQNGDSPFTDTFYLPELFIL